MRELLSGRDPEIVDDKIIDNDRGYLHTVNTANGKSLFSGRLLDDNPSGSITSGVVAGDHFVFYNRLPDESQLWSPSRGRSSG